MLLEVYLPGEKTKDNKSAMCSQRCLELYFFFTSMLYVTPSHFCICFFLDMAFCQIRSLWTAPFVTKRQVNLEEPCPRIMRVTVTMMWIDVCSLPCCLTCAISFYHIVHNIDHIHILIYNITTCTHFIV